jgi:hypothetical protein
VEDRLKRLLESSEKSLIESSGKFHDPSLPESERDYWRDVYGYDLGRRSAFLQAIQE